ncbi:MAG: DUF4287 domain-containing protein [Chloroflexota bacterium]
MEDASRTRPPSAQSPIGDDAFVRATGKPPADWFALIDAWGGEQRSHAEIARWLADEHGLGGWWAQNVTVSYERARGLRAVNQKTDGFAVSVSRTLDVAPDLVSAWFTHDALRDRWLEPGLLSLRTVQLGRSARFNVAGGDTRLAVWLSAKPGGRTGVQVQHERLPDADAVDHWRAFWKERLNRLAAAIANG